MSKKIVMICVLVSIGSMVLAGCTSSPQNGDNSGSNSNPPNQTDTEILIPLSDLGATAKFYSFESDGITIRYFAMKDASDIVHIAFDACDVCYEAKKGYRQNGNLMQCINCGNQYPIESIGTENLAGGCWPSYLHYNIIEQNVVITISDLVEKQYMFS